MDNLWFLQVHGGASHDGGFAGDIAGWLTYLEQLVNVATNKPPALIPMLLPGISAMMNIHPLLVHFPIALLTTFFVVDLIASLFSSERWRGLASCLLYLGTLAAAVTAAAGVAAANSVPHSEEVHTIMERHEHFGVAILTLATFLSIWRLKTIDTLQGGANRLFLLLAAVLCVLIGLGADLGGLMVYRYGVSVKAALPGENTISPSHAHHH